MQKEEYQKAEEQTESGDVGGTHRKTALRVFGGAEQKFGELGKEKESSAEGERIRQEIRRNDTKYKRKKDEYRKWGKEINKKQRSSAIYVLQDFF